MAVQVALPEGFVTRETPTGLVVAARDIGALIASASQVIEFCRLPPGACLMELGIFCNTALGVLEIGVEPVPGETSPALDRDAFRAAANLVANSRTVLAGRNTTNGAIPQIFGSGARLTMFTTTPITSSITGTIWALYSMDAYIDNTDQKQLLSSA